MKLLRLLPTLALLTGCLGPLGLPVPDVSIDPEAPDPDDDLVLVLQELPAGPALPTLTYQIEWQQDGEAVPELAGAEVVASSWTTAGETWTAVVAAVQGELVGPPGQASVEISADGDDDDTGPDDDDTADDDDVVAEAVGPKSRLCSSAGRSTNSIHTAVTCTGPVEMAPGVSTNGTYTVVSGTLHLISQSE